MSQLFSYFPLNYGREKGGNFALFSHFPPTFFSFNFSLQPNKENQFSYLLFHFLSNQTRPSTKFFAFYFIHQKWRAPPQKVTMNSQHRRQPTTIQQQPDLIIDPSQNCRKVSKSKINL